MSTEPETTAAETTPVPSPDLSAAASPAAEAASATARADGDAAAESQPEILPGPAPETGQPAGDEPAAGPGSPPQAPPAEAYETGTAPSQQGTPAGLGSAPAHVSLRELEARISRPLQCQAEPSWPDLMQRAAADEEPWRGITDTLIAAGHAEMPARQWRAWFGDRPQAAAA